MSTHYATLGLPANAPPAAIRQAYRRLVLLTHPDRTPDPAAHQRFLAVNDAYDVLRDPARRAAYDATLRRAAAPAFRPPSPGSAPRNSPPRHARPGPQAQPRRQSKTVSFDLRPYARPIRWLGRLLLAFGLLLLLDYGCLDYTAPARCLALKVASPDSMTTLVTTRGRADVYGPLPADILAVPLQVRSSLIFRFVREVLLPDGRALPVQRRGTSLPGFVCFMLPLALLSQWSWLSLAMRLNALMLAGITTVLILLLLLR
ncbi:J domain-containing protein [Hymenobacter rubripertinctus]|uniref:J domain-containing protein n=1 Tax=Hymenobacter rubripertinctus TaxID=2029981 RepID=A0A418QUP0_9BACT|nr:J domain-containing protein [Hymenobacter rubripertinctus]RIY08884.1 J domain-containing protein [Hymenobacter rubripertinctus]